MRGGLSRLVSTVRENWRDSSFWLDGPAFVWRHVLTAPVRRVGYARARQTGLEPQRLAAADWDNCLILDACRFDTFERVLDRDWDLQARLASGSDTGEFVASNYPPSATEPDLVYVNANPRVASEPTGEFHAMRHVWQTDWDDDLGTVHPASVREAAVEAAAEFPHKRLLVHFVQPHIPYIGETAEDLPGGAAIQSMRPGGEMTETKPYALVRNGAVGPERIRTAYRESLELALEEVTTLVEALPGKTVVTADHGEILGETGARVYGEFTRWGHPSKTPVEPLLKVPWAVAPYTDRKQTEAGSVTDTNEAEPDHEQLESLGYL